MDRFKFTTIAHHGRELLGPLSLEAFDALLAKVTPARMPHDTPRILDVGCGKGEMLLRAMERFAAEGVGIEPNPTFASEARSRALARRMASRCTVHATALEHAPVPHGRFDVALCVGATGAFGGDRGAYERLVQFVRPSGWAIVGTGYWRHEPAADYLAVLGAAEAEMTWLGRTLEGPAEANWRLVAHHASTVEEWDEYEGEYAAAMRRWLDARPADPDAAAFRERIDRWTDAYARWGRDTLGFVTMVLRR